MTVPDIAAVIARIEAGLAARIAALEGALEKSRAFVADELETRESSFLLPAGGSPPEPEEWQYIADARETLAAIDRALMTEKKETTDGP